MEEKFLEEMLKMDIEQIVKAKVEEEIKQKVEEFRRELEDRKDNYISEIMKGIRIYHERDMGSMGINYKIVFENVYRIDNK